MQRALYRCSTVLDVSNGNARRPTAQKPALHSPPPLSTPPEFTEAEREELVQGRPEIALRLYQQVSRTTRFGVLALRRVAQTKRAPSGMRWLQIIRADLAHRPFGIVASIEGGETTGLLETINGGRWNLPADQAEFFATEGVQPGWRRNHGLSHRGSMLIPCVDQGGLACCATPGWDFSCSAS
jgi:hypothetical protein